MKVETIITIEADLPNQVDVIAKKYSSRSEVFEKALQEFLPKLQQKPKRKLTDDDELINRYAKELNEEALDTLHYQAEG